MFVVGYLRLLVPVVILVLDLFLFPLCLCSLHPLTFLLYYFLHSLLFSSLIPSYVHSSCILRQPWWIFLYLSSLQTFVPSSWPILLGQSRELYLLDCPEWLCSLVLYHGLLNILGIGLVFFRGHGLFFHTLCKILFLCLLLNVVGWLAGWAYGVVCSVAGFLLKMMWRGILL